MKLLLLRVERKYLAGPSMDAKITAGEKTSGFETTRELDSLGTMG
jgi:hypothetical protein